MEVVDDVEHLMTGGRAFHAVFISFRCNMIFLKIRRLYQSGLWLSTEHSFRATVAHLLLFHISADRIILSIGISWFTVTSENNMLQATKNIIYEDHLQRCCHQTVPSNIFTLLFILSYIIVVAKEIIFMYGKPRNLVDTSSWMRLYGLLIMTSSGAD